MAFNKAYLTRIGGSANQNVYTYWSNDTQATIIGSGYFDDMIDDFNVGDIIIVVFDADGTIGVTEIFITSVTSAVTSIDNVTQT